MNEANQPLARLELFQRQCESVTEFRTSLLKKVQVRRIVKLLSVCNT